MCETSKPFISVIIPTYHDWARLKLCIDALKAQTYPAELFEVIIVNNDPEDIASELNLPQSFQLISEAQPGSYAARNAGISVAKGDYLAFTDADCIPDTNWLKEVSDFYRENKNLLMSGRVEMFSERGISGTLNIAESYDYIFGINQEIYIKKNSAATANLVVPKNIIKTLNGFNDTLFSGGDTDFCLRANDAGYSLAYNPKAVVKHPLRASKEDLLIKARRLTAGKYRKNKFKAMIITLSPPIVRLKVLFWEKKSPLNTKLKALFMLSWIKINQITYMLNLIFFNKEHERR